MTTIDYDLGRITLNRSDTLSQRPRRVSIRYELKPLTREEMLRFGWAHFAFGLICTWIVGVGRYWDHPSAAPWQYAGLGSLASPGPKVSVP